jgi:hypothetical protein
VEPEVDPDDFEEKQEPLENANLDQLDELGEVCSYTVLVMRGFLNIAVGLV